MIFPNARDITPTDVPDASLNIEVCPIEGMFQIRLGGGGMIVNAITDREGIQNIIHVCIMALDTTE